MVDAVLSRPFAETFAERAWYVLSEDGRYLAATAPGRDGRRELTTGPVRELSLSLRFTIVSAVSRSLVLARVEDAESGRHLVLEGDGRVLLSEAAGTVFTIRGTRSLVFSMDVDGAGLRRQGKGFVALPGSRPSPLRLAPQAQSAPLLWVRRAGTAGRGGPAVFGGCQVVSGKAPFLTCLDNLTGLPLWTYGPTVAATSPPAVSWSGRLAIAAQEQTVHAVSLDTAAEVWTFTADGQVFARPRAVADLVFVSASTGVLHAVSAKDGTARWRYPATGGLFTTPVHDGGALYVGSRDGSIHAVDAATGKGRWSRPTGAEVTGTVLVADGRVYAGNQAGAVVALDATTGRQLWKAQVGTLPLHGRPAVIGGLLLVGTQDGHVVALDHARDGAAVWSESVGAKVLSDLAVSDGIAYLTTGAARLWALTPAPRGRPATTSQFLGGTAMHNAVTVFSGAVHTQSGDGTARTYSHGLRADYAPGVAAMALRASALADEVTVDHAPALPAGWTLIGRTATPDPGGYGTVLVIAAHHPVDDRQVAIVAFGVRRRAIPNSRDGSHDPAKASLAPVPPSIIGRSVSAGMVTRSVLREYRGLRATVLALLRGPAPGGPVIVTGLGQGGALATLAAFDLSIGLLTGTGLTCLTFGAPPTGNDNFAARFDTTVGSSFRLVVDGDRTVNALGRPWTHVRAPVSLGQGFPVVDGGGRSQLATYLRAMEGTG